MNGPRRIGDYEIVEVLGRGGMGVVFKARHPKLPRAVALKRVTKASGKALARFRREGILLARVQHPNVVTVHEFGSSPEGPFLVLDLVPGTSLQEQLLEGPFEALTAASIVSDLADAVQALHALEILHRDLKPDNVILRESDGAPILIDFGLAFAPDQDRLTRTGAVVGTLHYMAPEQMGGERVDARADVYGLGGILYALLSGESPFCDAESVQSLMVAVSHSAPNWRRIKSAPPSVQAIVRRCMAKKPSQRYPSAAALHEALEAALSEDPSEQGPGSGGPVWVAAGFLVALALAVVFVLGGGRPAATRVAQSPPTSPVVEAEAPPTEEPLEPEDPPAPRVTAWAKREALTVEAPWSRTRGAVGFLDPERLVVACDDGKTLGVWSPASGRLVALPPMLARHMRGLALRSGPDGEPQLVIGREDSVVVVPLPPQDPRGLQTVPIQGEMICMALTADGTQLVYGTLRGEVLRLDLKSGQILARVRHGEQVRVGAVAVAGDLVVSASGRPQTPGGPFTVVVWRGPSLAEGWKQGEIFSSVEALAVDPSGSRIAVGTEQGRVFVGALGAEHGLQALQGLDLPEPKGFAVLGGHGVPLAHEVAVRRVLWSPDGGVLYSITLRSPDSKEGGSHLRSWDPVARKQLGFSALELGVTNAALSARGDRLAIAGWAGGFQLLEPRE